MAPSWWPDVKKVFDDLGVPMEVWVPIMWGESQGHPAVVNDTRGRTDLREGTQPEYSVGLFQVNVLAHWPRATAEEQERRAELLKDPVQNAIYWAPHIAGVWNAIKSTAVTQPAETWAALVGVRGGSLGGSPEHPLTSDYAREYQAKLTERASNMLPYIQQGIDFFGADWMGRLRGAASGATATLAGSAPGGAVGSFVAGVGASGLGAAGTATVEARESISDSVKSLLANVDWTRAIVFLIGVILVTISIASILNEQVSPKVKGGVTAIVKSAAKAVDNPTETLVDVASD